MIDPKAVAATNETKREVLSRLASWFAFGSANLEIAVNAKTHTNGEKEKITFASGYAGNGTLVPR